MNLILQGLGVGFSIAAPVGAIGFLCIQQTLRGGISLGLACGLGAATADMMYGILVAFGLQSAHIFLLSIKTPLSFLGAIVLCYMGLKKFFAKVTFASGSTSEHNDIVKAYVLTFFLTLTNPATILDFLAFFTSLQINVSSSKEAFNFIAGVFIGSALWWFLLCSTVGIFRKKVSQELLQYINYAAGIVILSFGMYALVQLM